MQEPIILLEKRGAIALVTLNRPAKMNALSQALCRSIVETFRALQQDDSIAVVVLTGSGKGFCAGLDLNELGAGTGANDFSIHGAFDIEKAIAEFDRPVIGAINGVAATGGFELALMCDVLIASTQARFADTHARFGLVPGWGLSQKLTRMIGANRARELHFTGNFLSAERAEAWGLVNRVVEPEQLLEVSIALAADMAGCDRAALRAYKRMINEGLGMTLADGLRFEKLAVDYINSRVAGAAIGASTAGVQARARE